MTKLEFYYNIKRIVKNILKDKYEELLEIDKSYKKNFDKEEFKEEFKKGSYYHRQRLIIKNNIKIINELEITLKNTNIMYNMLECMNLEYDFHDNYIIIHYPEIQMEINNHVIKDLYFMFKPVISNAIGELYLKTKAFRTTYSYMEYVRCYCHPHIQFPSLGHISDSICYGSTLFIYNNDFVNNFIRFLLYLDVYIRHEYDRNPFQRTYFLKEKYSNINVNLENISRKVEKINWSKYKLDFTLINGKEYICPKMDLDEIEEYVKDFDKNIKIHVIDGENELNDNTVFTINEVNNKKTYIKDWNDEIVMFKQQPLTIKIYLNETTFGYSREWKERLRKESANFLTKAYLEAYSNNFQTCDETEQIFMLEDTQ